MGGCGGLMRYFKGHMAVAFLAAVAVLAIAGGCASAKSKENANSALPPDVLYENGMAKFQIGLLEDAEGAFKNIVETYPLSSYAVDAQLMLADTCYAEEKYEDAASYYTTFYTFHPAHERAPYALFRKGMSHFKEVLSVDRDQTSTRKALFAFRDLIAAFPDSPYAAKANELSRFLEARLVERELYVAKFYYNGKNYKGALMRLAGIVKEYPSSALMPEVLFFIGKAYDQLGEKALAQEAFNTIVTAFPESPFANDAKKWIKG